MAEFTAYPPGAFCYLDLGTTDPEAATAFYTGLLGLEATTEEMPGGPSYTRLTKGGRWVAGLYAAPPGMPSAWILHVAADDLEAALARAEAAGGTVVAAPTEVPGTGRFAVLADPQGAVFSLWQGTGFAGSELANEHGTLIWSELATTDPGGAASFYGDLFGWEAHTQEMSTGPYTVFMDGEASRAGALTITPEMGPMPPSWSAYLAVDDLDAALATADAAGATRLGPLMDMPDVGRMQMIQDPTGAVLSLMEPAPGSVP